MSIPITKGLAFCALIAPAAAGASDWSSLLNNNPFLPPGSAQTQAQPVQSLELRGVVVESGTAWFTFFDSATKKWTTVRQGEDGDSLVVRSYDKTQDVVVLDVRGKKVTLSLKAAGNQSYGRSAAMTGVASAAPESHVKPFMVPEKKERGQAEHLTLDRASTESTLRAWRASCGWSSPARSTM